MAVVIYAGDVCCRLCFVKMYRLRVVVRVRVAGGFKVTFSVTVTVRCSAVSRIKTKN